MDAQARKESIEILRRLSEDLRKTAETIDTAQFYKTAESTQVETKFVVDISEVL